MREKRDGDRNQNRGRSRERGGTLFAQEGLYKTPLRFVGRLLTMYVAGFQVRAYEHFVFHMEAVLEFGYGGGTCLFSNYVTLRNRFFHAVAVESYRQRRAVITALPSTVCTDCTAGCISRSNRGLQRLHCLCVVLGSKELERHRVTPTCVYRPLDCTGVHR